MQALAPEVRSTEVDPARPTVPALYWRILRAAVTLLESGKAATQVNLAVQMGVSKQAVWKFLKRHPDVMGFIDDELRAANAKMFGLVQRRMAVLGMQGSAQHAEVFFKAEAGAYAKPVGQEGAVVAPGAFTLNLLVPRPETAQLPGAPVPALSTAIPTVAVR